ncbi:hypothetical protein ONZ43_g4545 [Nemania bipapillata]|uniref:Uncharacterized protein n=1 Tax=Nemania bipapillata TaxID=110536 RepID=A0ACC2ILB8_9PEZI|nr:hypothetical protein ONZ43_g4545 [Nemania bipapillata]
MDIPEPHQKLRPLCEICRTVPFKEIQENPNTEFDSVDLGTYSELRQRTSCPFCGLVFEMICEISRHAGFLDPDKFLDQTWSRNITSYWQGHSFDTIVAINQLRFTTGACSRLGRVVSPAPIEFDAITSLLQDCDASHQCSLSMSDEAATRLRGLRAIDIQQMCITSISSGTRYMALSYVWGMATVLHLVRDNKDELMRPHALEAYEDMIPLTIRDAIKLARKMNIG